MRQITTLWSGLERRRQVIVIMAALGAFLAVLGLGRMASSPSMALLYAGLESDAAGEVVAALEARGVTFDIRGDSIWVATPERDVLRMTLAGEGLPASGGQGYELLDELSGFGTTSRMFDAAYWRAKEGELARTILASPAIRTARVHIATPSSRPFARESVAGASVTVTPAGGDITPAHARALKHLVASAVVGLGTADVTVIDGRGGRVLDGDEVASSGADSRSERLKSALERLVEAHVGPGNAVVEVAVDTVTEREQITERRFDPEGRVAISTDSEETQSTSNETAGGGVTVASNLPEGEAEGDDRASQTNRSESRQRTNFEVSETQREVLRLPGAVRRIGVAVLVDGVRTAGPDGDVEWTPRGEEDLADLRELVAAAVGFDAERGDTITIRSMQFEPAESLGTDAAPGLIRTLGLDAMALIQVAVLALVALILGLFVVRPILGGSRPAEIDAPVPASAALGAPAQPASLPTGEPHGPPAAQTLPALADASAQPDAVARLRRLIEDRQDESVEVLRSWMENKA